jgi:hypothetical protein
MGSTGSDAALCFGLDAREGGADGRLPCGRDAAGPPLAGDPKPVPSSPEYSSLVVPSCSLSANSPVMQGTGPRTSRKPILCGRSKVTVSSVAAVSLP